MSDKFEDNKVIINFISAIICSQYIEVDGIDGIRPIRQEDLLSKAFMSEILTFLQRF
jgi:hypothetical protein